MRTQTRRARPNSRADDVSTAGTSGKAGRAADPAIDKLYQLPLQEFVAARNRMAGDASGEQAAQIRAFPKPSVIAWALNQLYWRARPVFDRLVEAAARLRASQAEALVGRTADLRSADAEHRQAMGAAIEQASRILQEASHRPTPDSVRALTAALEALPWKERPGRLARPPGAPGFAAFDGLPGLPGGAERLPQPKGMAGSRRAPGGQAAKPAPARAAQRLAEASREHAERLREARNTVEEARQAAAAAAARASANESRAVAAREAEHEARERLEESRRELREAEAERRDAARAELGARAALREAEEALARLER